MKTWNAQDKLKEKPRFVMPTPIRVRGHAPAGTVFEFLVRERTWIAVFTGVTVARAAVRTKLTSVLVLSTRGLPSFSFPRGDTPRGTYYCKLIAFTVVLSRISRFAAFLFHRFVSLGFEIGADALGAGDEIGPVDLFALDPRQLFLDP